MCREISRVTLGIHGRLLRVKVIVMNEIIDGVDVIVSIDIISQLGGVTIYENDFMEFRGGALYSKYATNNKSPKKQWVKSG